MNGDSFGNNLIVTTKGSSHDLYEELFIDNYPSGIVVDYDLIDSDLARRRPQYDVDTPRNEVDRYEILSGVEDGKTNGNRIYVRVENRKVDSSKYDFLNDFYRPSHADYVYEKKYGKQMEPGGGRFSARETVMRVVAGSFAKMLLNEKLSHNKIEFYTWTYSVGNLYCEDFEEKLPDYMLDYLREIRKDGDSVGGSVRCVMKNVPAGIGEPVFHKLHACLGYAMLSIPAARAFEVGRGVNASSMKGSEHNDCFMLDEISRQVVPAKNDAGGIIGGVSSGQDIIITVHFKPLASIRKPQITANKRGEMAKLEIIGSHDVCCAVRAVAVVEAMAAIVLADFLR